MFLNKSKFLKSLQGILITFVGFLSFSCDTSYKNPIVIWTNKSEFASYVELFNASQDDYKAIVVYKESPAESFPVAKDETPPDLVIGPWLKNQTVRKNFIPLDYLLKNVQMQEKIFYPQLLEVGNINDSQYLLPVSFNIPAIIFSKQNKDLIKDNYLLSLDEIKEISATFNKKNKSKIFTSMGFAPRWNSDFLYTVAKMQGCNFQEQGRLFSWDKTNIENTINYLKDWTITNNESTSSEDDFSFKYLYMPGYKLVSTEHCLFSYTTSDKLFSIPEEKLSDIDFRWVHFDNKIPVEDDIISLGLYRKARNIEAAEAFIIWLMKEDSQRAILERNKNMKLNTSTFGIAGGFSAIKSVNERVFTQFNSKLMGNLPIAEYLQTPNILPPHWDKIKERVIIPYLLEATNTETQVTEQVLLDKISEWNKQYF